MSERSDSGDPLDRVIVRITGTSVLRATRFCLEECGLYGEAQLVVAATTAMNTGEIVKLSWDEDNSEPPTIDSGETTPPSIVLSCKGPRKKYLLFGELTCRGCARID